MSLRPCAYPRCREIVPDDAPGDYCSPECQLEDTTDEADEVEEVGEEDLDPYAGTDFVDEGE